MSFFSSGLQVLMNTQTTFSNLLTNLYSTLGRCQDQLEGFGGKSLQGSFHHLIMAIRF